MSKTSSSRLTPLRKTRRPARSRRLDVLDEINTRCKRAVTLAEMLAACGRCEGAEPLEAAMVAGAGELILVEIRALRALLETVWREAAR